ncbi:nitrogen fixation protein NifR [Staphylococcus aureus]|nr:nitrogen fixation protein NifR [Staphylococcus aureus]
MGFPISTDNASWRGPNTEADEKSAYNNVQVGVGRRNKFCENIISVPLSNLSWIYLYLNPLLLVYESIMKAL